MHHMNVSYYALKLSTYSLKYDVPMIGSAIRTWCWWVHVIWSAVVFLSLGCWNEHWLFHVTDTTNNVKYKLEYTNIGVRMCDVDEDDVDDVNNEMEVAWWKVMIYGMIKNGKPVTFPISPPLYTTGLRLAEALIPWTSKRYNTKLCNCQDFVLDLFDRI
eukprot:PhF_6_TR10362/c0_g3_i3/m.16066